jgi:hypothetical protein
MPEILNRTIHLFIDLTDEYFPRKGFSVESTPIYKSAMLDYILQYKKLIKGLGALAERNDFSFYNVPMFLICRSLTANALTIYYIACFYNEHKVLDNETICNEFRALMCEYINFEMEFYSLQQGKTKEQIRQEYIEKYPDYFEDGKLKTRSSFHLSSNQEIISSLRLKDNMLSENQKAKVALDRLESRQEIITTTLMLNKLFTQYYHYNPVGAEWSRKTHAGASKKHIFLCLICATDALFIALQHVKDILPSSDEAIEEFSNLGKYVQEEILPTL